MDRVDFRSRVPIDARVEPESTGKKKATFSVDNNIIIRASSAVEPDDRNDRRRCRGGTEGDGGTGDDRSRSSGTARAEMTPRWPCVCVRGGEGDRIAMTRRLSLCASHKSLYIIVYYYYIIVIISFPGREIFGFFFFFSFHVFPSFSNRLPSFPVRPADPNGDRSSSHKTFNAHTILYTAARVLCGARATTVSVFSDAQTEANKQR